MGYHIFLPMLLYAARALNAPSSAMEVTMFFEVLKVNVVISYIVHFVFLFHTY